MGYSNILQSALWSTSIKLGTNVRRDIPERFRTGAKKSDLHGGGEGYFCQSNIIYQLALQKEKAPGNRFISLSIL